RRQYDADEDAARTPIVVGLADKALTCADTSLATCLARASALAASASRIMRPMIVGSRGSLPRLEWPHLKLSSDRLRKLLWPASHQRVFSLPYRIRLPEDRFPSAIPDRGLPR